MHAFILIIHPTTQRILYHTPSHPPSPTSRNIKPKPPHTIPIPLYRAPARLLRVLATAEEHAFIPERFFIFADAAGL